ncbi:MAG: Rieske 2Fe-2S domain-containing protein [candidate division Zixibacteria bacterium]|nr:Rieske 2Fe-2S domain-containing protein [candidate division Zixibacteria bacterium]
MYDPSRKVTGAIGTFVKEAANSVAQYKNYLTGNGDESLDTIERGSGAVIDKTAVYRDGDGHLHAFSAICPHLKCLVRRNDEEQSFDCPCHGSRFSFDGKVVNGPANVNLEETEIPTKKYKE